MREMIARHWEIWKESLAADRERLKTKIEVKEADFLPAALEILESPASPIGRGIIWVLCSFCLITLLWSIFGQMDIVATAQGKLVPRGHVKTIQPAELGVVKYIAVENGQEVKAGDLLLNLDTTISGADKDQAAHTWLVNRLIAIRQNVILDRAQGRKAAFTPPPEAPAAMVAMHERIIDSRLQEYRASMSSLEAQLTEKKADLQMVKTELNRLQEMLPGLDEQLVMRQKLMEKGLNSRLMYLDAKQKRDEHQKDIDVDRDRLAKEAAGAQGVEQQVKELKQKFRKENLAELAEAEEKAAQAKDDLTKATRRTGLQELRSPIDGTVVQLKVHTLGGVVQAGQELMTIVPSSGALAAEAMVLNKDIGFVHEGQAAEIKLEAFPFTRYGVIHGKVEDVADDAMVEQPGQAAAQGGSENQSQNSQQGLVYPARVSLAKAVIRVDGKNVPLAPGMAVTVEIKTGKRRIIEYFLSPIMRYSEESLRER